MNDEQWKKAAELYRGTGMRNLFEEVEKRQARQKKAQEEAVKEAEEQLHWKEGFRKAIHDLDAFLSSNAGKTGLELLAASKRHIILGEERGGGFADVIFLDGRGLQRSIEPSGESWLFGSQKAPEPKISGIRTEEAIRNALCYSRRPADQIVPYIIAKLNEIAGAAQ